MHTKHVLYGGAAREVLEDSCHSSIACYHVTGKLRMSLIAKENKGIMKQIFKNNFVYIFFEKKNRMD